jgi:tetratricopeptide (TPR) repeat protein
LVGFNRYKQRGDQFFLESNFAGALQEYRRARSTLAPSDYRAVTLDALIRECSVRIGEPVQHEEVVEEEPPGFMPGMGDLFELAIADKPAERLKAYRGLGRDFEAGYVWLVQGDAERAIPHLQGAARKNPSTFILQLELGRALSLSGQMESSRFELEKAVRLDPLDLEGLNLLAAVLIQLGRFDEASRILDPLAQKEDAGPETFFLLGQCLVGLGREDEALERFRETVAIDSLFHEAFFEGAMLLKKRGDIPNALPLMSRACTISPDEVSYNLELVEWVLAQDLDEEIGLAACDRLMVTDEPNQWRYLGWVAELYLRRGWRREARDPLRKALNLVPPDRTEERQRLQRQLAELEGQESPS